MAHSHITDARLAKIVETGGRAEQHEVMIIAAELLARRARDEVDSFRRLIEETKQAIDNV